MNIEISVKKFPSQFSFKPKIENSKKLVRASKILVSGMGGSALAAEILKCGRPDLNLSTFKSYDLPQNITKDILVIASSYSGNTAETVSSFEKARKQGNSLAVITAGGKLLGLAKKYKIPYVRISESEIQPRISLGFNLLALLKLIGEEREIKKASKLARTLDTAKAEKLGRSIAEKLWDKIPIIYASTNNFAIAYNWKIKFNETGKIPAFCNVFPELNHNEMTGFDVIKTTRILSHKFHFIFIKDPEDDPKTQKRMLITKNLYRKRGFLSEIVELQNVTVWHKIFQNLITADWAAINAAKYYGTESTEVPMVEEFKRLIK
ncbi:MAG: glucose/mannose-6-phosphate isomerase [Parcubacteria group bacterium Gr01-1014_20]|nr:MAG: glucose/mannose-6-phosphate isomerase [Parcubacteria group bacterium Gr01-1014_20]